MAKKQEKTNVMRILDQKKIQYSHYAYDNTKLNAEEVANALNQEVGKVFKTLVTVGKSKEHYVFVVPANKELDLKKAAKAAKEKSIEMIHQKELLPLTGYIHGGCSPIGMKKQYPTFIHEAAKEQDKITVSGGRLGLQITLSPDDLCRAAKAEYADIIK